MHVLDTSTPLAVLVAQLNTVAAFATLAVAEHRGLFSMGVLLGIAILFVLIVSLVVLPSFMIAIGVGAKAAANAPARPRLNGARRSSPAAAASSAGISSRRFVARGDEVRVLDVAPPRGRRSGGRVSCADRSPTAPTCDRALEGVDRALSPRRHRASLAARQGRLRPRQPARHRDGARGGGGRASPPRRALLDGIDPAAAAAERQADRRNRASPRSRTWPGPIRARNISASRRRSQAARDGLDVVVVNPTVPIGDGDRNMTPPAAMLALFLSGRLAVLPRLRAEPRRRARSGGRHRCAPASAAGPASATFSAAKMWRCASCCRCWSGCPAGACRSARCRRRSRSRPAPCRDGSPTA